LDPSAAAQLKFSVPEEDAAPAAPAEAEPAAEAAEAAQVDAAVQTTATAAERVS